MNELVFMEQHNVDLKSHSTNCKIVNWTIVNSYLPPASPTNPQF